MHKRKNPQCEPPKNMALSLLRGCMSTTKPRNTKKLWSQNESIQNNSRHKELNRRFCPPFPAKKKRGGEGALKDGTRPERRKSFASLRHSSQSPAAVSQSPWERQEVPGSGGRHSGPASSLGAHTHTLSPSPLHGWRPQRGRGDPQSPLVVCRWGRTCAAPRPSPGLGAVRSGLGAF